MLQDTIKSFLSGFRVIHQRLPNFNIQITTSYVSSKILPIPVNESPAFLLTRKMYYYLPSQEEEEEEKEHSEMELGIRDDVYRILQ